MFLGRDLHSGLYLTSLFMISIDMNKSYHPARILLLGLLTAQVIAVLQVYLSNSDLYQILMDITAAGYLAVPNQHIMHHLKEFTPALIGGVFFTFSIGAGLSIVTLGALWCWNHIFYRKKLLLILYLSLWAACLVKINLNGLSPLITLYFFGVPSSVAALTLRWLSADTRKPNRFSKTGHFVPVIILALLWFSQINSNIFLNIRDNLLLTNPMGIRFNDIYYKYTLYPARVLKSINQRMLKTCDLESIKEERLKISLEKILLDQDYLNAGYNVPVDLTIVKEHNLLALKNRGKIILKVTEKSLLSNPAMVLREFSLKSDKYAFFRQATFYSLLMGFPVALYIFFHAFFRFVCCFFLSLKNSSVAASIFCFLIGVALLFSFLLSKGEKIGVENVADALASDRWQDRILALKTVTQKGMEIGDFPIYPKILDSTHIPERYWFAGTLAVSRKAETYKDLLQLVEDQHPNVVCKALESLGKRGNRDAVEKILKKIETSDHWYIQWYAYRALRALGWKQTRSR